MIETYMLDGGRDLYGRDVVIEFYERLRGDQVFDSPDDLSQQIAADVDRTRAILQGLPHVPARPSVS